MHRDVKLVEMGVGPPHHDLNYQMEVARRTLAVNGDASLYRRVDVQQGDLELVDHDLLPLLSSPGYAPFVVGACVKVGQTFLSALLIVFLPECRQGDPIDSAALFPAGETAVSRGVP